MPHLKLLGFQIADIFRFFRTQEGEGQVIISVSGEEYGVYSLAEDRTISVNDTNRLIIRLSAAGSKWPYRLKFRKTIAYFLSLSALFFLAVRKLYILIK